MSEGGSEETDQSILQPDSPLQLPVTSNTLDPPKYQIMNRPGSGISGRSIPVLVNHFKVSIKSANQIFYQYTVNISLEDGRAIESKRVRRRVIDKVFEAYSSQLAGKQFAFDGKEILYTVGPLPHETFEFTIALEESFVRSVTSGCPSEPTKRSKHAFPSRLFKVAMSFSTQISLHSIALASGGSEPDKSLDALRVLDTVLRQQAVNKGCLVVGQSFFKDDSRNLIEVGGGVTAFRGLYSSFRMSQAGLYLNMDVATTLVLKPGPVLDFLLANQNVQDYRSIDWAKARRMLKNLRIKTAHTNMEFKVIGLTDKPCYQLSFPLKVKNDDDVEQQHVETNVAEYFTKRKAVELTYSKYMPCLCVGKPKRPAYLPIELCSLVSLQRYTKALSPTQTALLGEKTKQKPNERMKLLADAAKSCQYDDEPFLAACGVSTSKQFMQIEGRVLDAPTLRVGNGEECTPCNARWSFKNKQFLSPVDIDCWAIVNFSSRVDTSHLSRELISCGRSKGVHIARPYALVEEDQRMRKASPSARVDEMFEKLQDKLPGEPQFILCVLPERKNCDLYGPWKMKSLTHFGIVTQCMSPVKITDNYLTNVLLKINSKLGGINSLLGIEKARSIPHVKYTPTMILGMDVSHGSPGRSEVPSIAAVVGSLSWPLISRYRAAVRTQSPRLELIDSLYKPLENGEDGGIMRELFKDFYVTSKGQKPKQIVIFRDGVGESQFTQVLNIELEQIKQAYLGLGEVEVPKFTVIIAQKNHHTRLFQAGSADNVPAGTIVDSGIVHPINYDFYMCSHGGIFGTLRPAHYHVLLDEIGFSTDELQNFIHSLSYVNQRSSFATSIAAPICYAHHAARVAGQFINFDDISETRLEKDDIPTTGSSSIPELPRLHENVRQSMFFC